jgi:putative two-component system response regulator
MNRNGNDDNNENPRPTILAVDDTPQNLSLICNLLENDYQLKVASSGARALKIAESDSPPDLILLDIMMPDMDGYEVCRRLKGNVKTMGIPVIFLTAKVDTQSEQEGLELGAVDYISKPISPPVMMARIKTHLLLKATTDLLRDKNNFLEQEIARRMQEINLTQDATILTVASLAETRDNETGNHILRTQGYVKALAAKLQGHPRFSAYLSDATIELLYKSAPLHDIGKVGIPDRILLKPGKLDFDEFEIMKTHTTLGRDAIESAESRLGHKVPFLHFAKEIAHSHQEKWDGSGYPEGLQGDAIPVSARLMAVADVYDALISRRVYKPAFPHEKAIAIILEGRGKHFDPDMVDAFVAIQDECLAIAERYIDSDADLAEKADRVSEVGF